VPDRRHEINDRKDMIAMNTRADRDTLSSPEVDAWAQHAHRANGFGDAVISHPTPRSNAMLAMPSVMQPKADSARYAKCVEVSKRIRWEIDRDVIRGRQFDFTKRFLPDGLSKVDRLDFLTSTEQRLLSQIQGRTYANIFGLVRKVRDLRPALDLAHRHDVDAVLVLADGEADELCQIGRVALGSGGLPIDG